MGGECGMCGGEEKVIHGFVEETKKKSLGRLTGVVGRIILERILK